ncbi:ATP-dependent RNA helicase HrpB [Cesiribacter andamanensis AMV16]|uniref:ATP-dependent RNA helicase HrpB n=1 Tax=Cesiribacter andamanensis AMV16 TaxID=1279009 RepID=M7MXF4_9BACT|nr:ATP-dependent RNA helicase HrpB [Cesiribacter andamanensis AMV16]
MAEQDLPVVTILPELKQQLASATTLILQAPPGAGKSTVLPLRLLHEPWLQGQKILMLEPRRLAARAVASRLAQQLGEALGQTVGYRIRFEQRIGPTTRLEVLTEGVLARMLGQDNGLEGVGLVIFDEFHERSLQADLALALCREIQGVLRDDLRLLIMSATLDGAELSRLLGGAPILTSQGRQYPISLRYLPPGAAQLPRRRCPGPAGEQRHPQGTAGRRRGCTGLFARRRRNRALCGTAAGERTRHQPASPLWRSAAGRAAGCPAAAPPGPAQSGAGHLHSRNQLNYRRHTGSSRQWLFPGTPL